MSSPSLAIIGAGSSGLVTLKLARDQLPGWRIVCFEKGPDTLGCWGRPYPGFVSTSTKYTTQFSCYRKWDATADPARRSSSGDFFVGDEYGRYLESFAADNDLAADIQLHTAVRRIRKDPDGWRLSIDDGVAREEVFDRLIICTGLAEQAKSIDSPIPMLPSRDTLVTRSRIVVMGGGESAADIAHRLADPALENVVYLSLKTGIRVSPRYHPIRGVPSDFLRNRLLLSIRQQLRNAIGQKFVEARIRHQERFEKFFKSRASSGPAPSPVSAKRKYWDARLTAGAKDHLFNVFHTKSDDFLDDVAAGRIHIVGAPCDDSHRRFHEFDSDSVVEIAPDYLCPQIGFTTGFEELSEGRIKVSDFHLGCLHVNHDDIFLIGFARPIIGNIPTISEMQARLVTGILAGRFSRPAGIAGDHSADRERIAREFPSLNRDTIHPVEMIPYCDRLARMMGTYPSVFRVGLLAWMRVQLAPASTTHYIDQDFDLEAIEALPIHSPPLITALLLLIKVIDWPLSRLSRFVDGSRRDR